MPHKGRKSSGGGKGSKEHGDKKPAGAAKPGEKKTPDTAEKTSGSTSATAGASASGTSAAAAGSSRVLTSQEKTMKPADTKPKSTTTSTTTSLSTSTAKPVQGKTPTKQDAKADSEKQKDTKVSASVGGRTAAAAAGAAAVGTAAVVASSVAASSKPKEEIKKAEDKKAVRVEKSAAPAPSKSENEKDNALDALIDTLGGPEDVPEPPQFTGPEVTEAPATSEHLAKLGERDSTIPPKYRELLSGKGEKPTAPPAKAADEGKGEKPKVPPLKTPEEGKGERPQAPPPKTDDEGLGDDDLIAALSTDLVSSPAPPQQKKPKLEEKKAQSASSAPIASAQPESTAISDAALDELLGTLDVPPSNVPESPQFTGPEITETITATQRNRLGDRDSTIPPEYRHLLDGKDHGEPVQPPVETPEPQMSDSDLLDAFSKDFDCSSSPAAPTPAPPATAVTPKGTTQDKPAKDNVVVPSSTCSVQAAATPSKAPSIQAAVTPSKASAVQAATTPGKAPSVQAATTPAKAPAVQAATTPAKAPGVQAATTPAKAPTVQAATTPAKAPTVQAAATPAKAPTVQAAATPANAPAVQAATTPAKAPAVQAAATPAKAPTVQAAATLSTAPAGDIDNALDALMDTLEGPEFSAPESPKYTGPIVTETRTARHIDELGKKDSTIPPAYRHLLDGKGDKPAPPTPEEKPMSESELLDELDFACPQSPAVQQAPAAKPKDGEGKKPECETAISASSTSAVHAAPSKAHIGKADPLDALAGTLGVREKDPKDTKPAVDKVKEKTDKESREKLGEDEETIPPDYRLKEVKDKDGKPLLPKPEEKPKPMSEDDLLDALSEEFVTSPVASAPLKPLVKFSEKPGSEDAVSCSKASAVQAGAPQPAGSKAPTCKADPLDTLAGTLGVREKDAKDTKPAADKVKEKTGKENREKLGEDEETIPPDYRLKEVKDKDGKPLLPKPEEKPQPMSEDDLLDALTEGFATSPVVSKSAPLQSSVKVSGKPGSEEIVSASKASAVQSGAPQPSDSGEQIPDDALDLLSGSLGTREEDPNDSKPVVDLVKEKAKEKHVERLGDNDETIPPEYRHLLDGKDQGTSAKPEVVKPSKPLDGDSAIDALSSGFASCDTGSTDKAKCSSKDKTEQSTSSTPVSHPAGKTPDVPKSTSQSSSTQPSAQPSTQKTCKS